MRHGAAFSAVDVIILRHARLVECIFWERLARLWIIECHQAWCHARLDTWCQSHSHWSAPRCLSTRATYRGRLSIVIIRCKRRRSYVIADVFISRYQISVIYAASSRRVDHGRVQPSWALLYRGRGCKNIVDLILFSSGQAVELYHSNSPSCPAQGRQIPLNTAG